jgi:hypothetical protein
MKLIKISNCKTCGKVGGILCKTVECYPYGAKMQRTCICCADPSCTQERVAIISDTDENVNIAITSWNTVDYKNK